MADNPFDQYDDGAVAPATTTVAPRPKNFFDNYDSDPAPVAPHEATVSGPDAAPVSPLQQHMVEGVSLTTARDSAQALTAAEREHPREETPAERASFWGAAEHSLGIENAQAYANTMNHLADMTGDPWWNTRADALRKAFTEDQSSYKSVYQSFKQIGGLSDLWGYTKETVGQQIGMMAPSIVGGLVLGASGASAMSGLGKTGEVVGGAVGGTVGAMAGNVHLQVSDMREALQREGVTGPNLVDYTNKGAAVLVGLDAIFPALQVAKIGGFARKGLAHAVAVKMGEELAKGGALKTPAEFIKLWGKDLIKDVIKYEVPTELAQEAVTSLGAKSASGKDITKGDVEKFALETAPEIVLRTVIGAAGMAAPGTAREAGSTIREAKAAFRAEQAKAPVETEAGKIDAETLPAPAAADGTPPAVAAAAGQPAMQDASKEAAAPPPAGQGVLQFLRDKGGIMPAEALTAAEAERFPGLVNAGGMTPDQAREALIEGGYLNETGADVPSVTSPHDVYDLVHRAISGEHIAPEAERATQPDAADAAKLLSHDEEQLIRPALDHYTEEFGDPVFAKAYKALSGEDRIETIDRVRRGEDLADVLEEHALREADVETIQAMIAKRGPDPVLLDRIRTMIAQQQPDLLAGFDDMIADLPVRRPKPAREATRPAIDPTVGLVRGMGARLAAVAGDASVFETALSEMERDRKILKADAYQIAADFLGRPPKKGTKASYFQAIRDARETQAAPAAAQSEATAALPELPAVPAKRSVAPGTIVSLADGSKHVDLRPHLEKLGVTAEQYAARYGLDDDYPLVAPNEVARRYNASGEREQMSLDDYQKEFTIGGARQAAGDVTAAAAPRDQETLLRAGHGAEAAQTLGATFQEDVASTRGRFKDNPEALKSLGRLTAAVDNARGLIVKGDAGAKAALQAAVIAAHAFEKAGPAAKLITQYVRSAARSMGVSDAIVEPARDLGVELTKVIAGKLPRAKWASSLGVTDAELKPHIERAVAAGLLRQDRHGVVRRVAAAREGFTPDAVAAEFDSIWGEPRPMEENEFGAMIPTKAGLDEWQRRIGSVINKLATMPVADAATAAEKMAGRKLSATEKRSRPQMIAAIKSHIDSLADSGYKMIAQGGQGAAFMAPGELGGEQVTLTDAAIGKIEQLRGIVTRAISGILPRDVRVDVVDNIEIGRLAREDELLSLRSSLSDNVLAGTEETADELSGDGAGAGAQGRSKDQKRGRATAATTGESLPGSREGRILRQESATLRADGSIIAGRISGESRPADARARDGAAVQPIGSTERFDAGEFTGVVTAANVAPHADLARRNARPSEYRLATLTYRLYASDTPISDAMLKGEFKPDFRANGDHHTSLIWARVSQHMDGTWEVSMVQRIADLEMAPKGMGAKLYAAIEKDLGIRMSPSGILSEQGHAMWQKRSPESVKWHQWSEFEGYFISPRRIKDNLDAIGGELRAIAARPDSDANKTRDLANARKERGELIKLWGKLPIEARAETPNMFSLASGFPGFFSSAIRAAEGISMKKGTGEQFLKQIEKAPGVRRDELDWMGLGEFLSGKASVTKDEVMEFMRAHRVELDERVRSGGAEREKLKSTQMADLSVLPDHIDAEVKNNASKGWEFRYGNDPAGTYHVVETHDRASDAFAFETYDKDWEHIGTASNLPQAEHIIVGNYAGLNDDAWTIFSDYKVPGGENYRELLIRLPSLGEPKALADLKKRLAPLKSQLAELDAARRSANADDREKYYEVRDQVSALENDIHRLEGGRGDEVPRYESKHFKDQEIVHLRVDDRTGPNGEKVLFINEVQSDLHQEGRRSGYGKPSEEERARLSQEYADLRANPWGDEAENRIAELRGILSEETSRVPSAPFKGDLWLELGLKKALQYASENGYDAISWARSDQIAKAVGAEPEKLALQYDSKIGKFLDKYTKKWGGKVEATSIVEGQSSRASLARSLDAKDESTSAPDGTNPLLRITPEMRDSVMRGQPLFSLPSSGNGALGQTDPRGQIISIGARAVEDEARRTGRSMASIGKQVARHEALEFFLAQGLIKPDEWSNLQSAARAENWVDETGVREPYTRKHGKTMQAAQLEDLILKESIMEKYGAYEAGTYEPKGIIATVFKRIKNFLDIVRNGLRGEGFQRWEDIFQKVDAGELRKRYEAIYGTGAAAQTQGAAAASAAAQSPQPMIRAGQIPGARGLQSTIGRMGELRGITDIITDLKSAIGLTHRTGRLDQGLRQRARAAGRPLLGQYNGVARTAISNDIDIIGHEAGHHLERTLGAELRNIMRANQAELTPLATPGNPLSEGFAEFFRRYVTNPTDAAARAPGFFRDFEDLLDAQHPQMLEQLQELQQAYDQFLLGDPVEQGIANQTVLRRAEGARSAFVRMMNDASHAPFGFDTFTDQLHTLYQWGVAQEHGWWMATRDLLNQIHAVTGRRITLNVSDNPNKLLRQVSHTAGWATRSLKDGMPLRSRPNGGGVSMHQVLATAFGSTDRTQWNERATQEFGEYLIARRAIHLWVLHRPAFRRNVTAFLQTPAGRRVAYLAQRLPANTASELERPPTKESLGHQLSKLAELEQRQPQFRQAAELYYQFNKDILEFLHEKHLLSDEEFNRLIVDRDYAPFQRDMSSEERADGDASPSRRPGRQRDTLNKHGVYRAIEGSYRDIINPVQSTVQHVHEILLRAAINDVLRMMDRLARQAGPAGNEIFERLPAHEARAVEVNIREALRNAGRSAGMSQQDISIMLANVENNVGQNAVATLFTYQQAAERGERIVWFYENGKPVPVQLADGELGRLMFEGLTATGNRDIDPLTKILSLGSISVRAGVTVAWEFVFRNIFVDALTSWVNSPHARPFLTQAAGIREAWRDGQYMQMYNRYGGMSGGEAVQSISDQSIERDIQALRSRGFEVRLPRSIREAARMLFKIGEFSETATRVGIFRNAMRSAIADGMQEQDAAIEAAHYAHDVYDFSRHGSKTEAARRIIPFWNASIQGLDKYVRTMTAANDYGTSLPHLVYTWFAHQQGWPLSENERRSLGQAAKAWAITTVVFGGMSLICRAIGADDDDLDEIPDNIRATHWVISLNGILHLIPKDVRTFLDGLDGEVDTMIRLPKTFEMAWFANGVERALDGMQKHDPTAFSGWLKDAWSTVMPPDSIPGLDLTYGFITGKDLYSGRDIIPQQVKGAERAEEYGPYTTWTAQKIGKEINMSPYYVDFLVRGLGASLGRDITSAIDIGASLAGANKAPAPSIEEFPIARRFTYNTARNSRSIGKFYDMVQSQEGLSAWFWDTVSKDARSFNAAAMTYKKFKDAGQDGPASEYLSSINPDQRVFAILSEDFKGDSKSKLHNLHPILNAQEGIGVANAIMREVVDGTLKVGKGKELRPLDQNEMRFARNEVGHIRKGMAQTALSSIGVEGWAQRPPIDIEKRLDTLRAGAPAVYDEMVRRLIKKSYQDPVHLAEVWGQVKERVEADRERAQLHDLASGGKLLAK